MWCVFCAMSFVHDCSIVLESVAIYSSIAILLSMHNYSTLVCTVNSIHILSHSGGKLTKQDCTKSRKVFEKVLKRRATVEEEI